MTKIEVQDMTPPDWLEGQIDDAARLEAEITERAIQMALEQGHKFVFIWWEWSKEQGTVRASTTFPNCACKRFDLNCKDGPYQ